MAISCEPDDLAESVKCLDKQDSQALLSQIVWLLCRINNMDCTPDTLAEETACLQNVDQQSLLAYAVYLLCQIVNGGLVAIDYIDDGAIDPVAAPTDQTKTNLYSNNVTGTLWIWPKNGIAWEQRT